MANPDRVYRRKKDGVNVAGTHPLFSGMPEKELKADFEEIGPDGLTDAERAAPKAAPVAEPAPIEEPPEVELAGRTVPAAETTPVVELKPIDVEPLPVPAPEPAPVEVPPVEAPAATTAPATPEASAAPDVAVPLSNDPPPTT